MPVYTYTAMASSCYTTFEFENEISVEARRIIEDGNPGYMGTILLAEELMQLGCEKPVAMRTNCNVRNVEKTLRVDDYFAVGAA